MQEAPIDTRWFIAHVLSTLLFGPIILVIAGLVLLVKRA